MKNFPNTRYTVRAFAESVPSASLERANEIADSIQPNVEEGIPAAILTATDEYGETLADFLAS